MILQFQIKKTDVDKRFIQWRGEDDDPLYVVHNLSTVIPKSLINASSKVEHLSNVPPDCQLIVKGIRPPAKVNLSTCCCDNLTLVDTVTSRSCNINNGPVAVASGMYVAKLTNVLAT